MFEFLVKGKFDCIELGQTQEWILNNFPDPEHIGKFNNGFEIWLYGKIEFHFYDKKLQMIFSDHFQNKNYGENFHAGNDFEMNAWIFDNPKNLTLINTMTMLNEHCIDFKKVTTDYYIHLVLNSGVVLGFYDENGERKLTNYNDYLMQTFHYSLNDGIFSQV